MPELGYTTAKMVSLESYDVLYGIESHDDKNRPGGEIRPLSLVGMHKAENTWKTHPLFEAARRYHRMHIQSLFGVSLTELLEMPRHAVEILYEVAEELNETGIADTERAVRELENKSKL